MIHVKPMVDSNYKNDDPDWVFYKTGQYINPLMIIHDGYFRKLIEEYCNYHKLKLVEIEKEVKQETELVKIRIIPNQSGQFVGPDSTWTKEHSEGFFWAKRDGMNYYIIENMVEGTKFVHVYNAVEISA